MSKWKANTAFITNKADTGECGLYFGGMGFLYRNIRTRSDFPPEQRQYRATVAFPMESDPS